MRAVSPTAHPGKGSSLPSCSSGPLARLMACVRGAGPVGGSAPVHAQSRAGQNRGGTHDDHDYPAYYQRYRSTDSGGSATHRRPAAMAVASATAGWFKRRGSGAVPSFND